MRRAETERNGFSLRAGASPYGNLQFSAPSEAAATPYDRQQLSLYAALLDANDAGQDWRDAAATLMGIDVAAAGAEACWRSHLERARWIVGEGLAEAIVAFGSVSRRVR